eukprot:NODE_122_length_17689_cov_1.046219.p11 type:complete len:117 gc:universal NODE_122_length_17689_cov_1.046219:5448-5798(+)
MLKTVIFYSIIYYCDLNAQIFPLLTPNISFEYTKAHDEQNRESINHAADYLTHFHRQSPFGPLKLTIADTSKKLRKRKEKNDALRLQYVKESNLTYHKIRIFDGIHGKCRIATAST